MGDKSFVRERRYLVAKLSDVSSALSRDEIGQLESIMAKVALHREKQGRPQLECVVVERDWPIHDDVWILIESIAGN